MQPVDCGRFWGKVRVRGHLEIRRAIALHIDDIQGGMGFSIGILEKEIGGFTSSRRVTATAMRMGDVVTGGLRRFVGEERFPDFQKESACRTGICTA